MIEGSPGTLPIRVRVRSKATAAAQVGADICVVGAGISGISAAIEAARLGRSVLLVDGLPSLGGQAVNSIIGTFCGLYSNGPNARQLTHGIADDILRELGADGAARPIRGPMTITVYYDEVALSRWIETTVRAAGIRVVVGAVLREVRFEDRRIKELSLATRYGDLQVTATGFVDATGDAALLWQAGLPCRQPDVPIYGTQIVVLEHLREEHKPSPKDYSARLAAKAPLDPIGASEKALEGKEHADRVVQFLKKEFPDAFGQARVRAYGLPGIRQTRWIVGRHQLTADEVRSGTHFEDEIARTAWPIELHGQPEGYLWEPFSDDHLHYVPLRSLIPADADNVLATGRCIDGDAAALSSVRVMGPCIGMGAAAAHALDLAGSGSVQQVDLGLLRRRLVHNLEG
jgi:FAD dependent oxidoreductase